MATEVKLVVGEKKKEGVLLGYYVQENGNVNYYAKTTLLAKVRQGRMRLGNMKYIAETGSIEYI